MKFISIILLIMTVLVSCNYSKKQSTTQPVSDLKSTTNYKLEKVWSTDSVFKTPESVLYDYARDVIYVSNVNENPWEKDGNGFISKLDLQGNIIELEWVKDMDAPKGMGMIDSMLYVANIDEVLEINVNKGEITRRIVFENEDGLNDITVGDSGEFYVSSSSNSIIYKVVNGVIEKLTQGGNERYNGLYFEPERLLIATSKGHQFKSYDFSTGENKVLVDSIGAGDGVVALPNGDYLVSDWNGEIFHINKNYEAVSILNTKDKKMNTADIFYMDKNNLLFVPTFFDNRVFAYHVVQE